MKKEFSFAIESLIYGNERMQAPLEPSLFSRRMAEKHGQLFFPCLCRVTFSDNAINKSMPGLPPLIETLLTGNHWFDDGELHIYVRGKGTYLHIATATLLDKKVEISKEYYNQILQDWLTKKQIEDIFKYVWENMDVLEPKPYSERPPEWD